MLRLRLLGSFELRGPGDRPLKITARKTRALLAYLALQNGTRQSRERLAALLWEDADAELARSSLRQSLTALRRALPAKLHSLLETDPQQVALNLAQVQVDVHSLRTHHMLTRRGYRLIRRLGLNGWYVPAGHGVAIPLAERWEILRKYYLALPFRKLRHASRRARQLYADRRAGR